MKDPSERTLSFVEGVLRKTGGPVTPDELKRAGGVPWCVRVVRRSLVVLARQRRARVVPDLLDMRKRRYVAI